VLPRATHEEMHGEITLEQTSQAKSQERDRHLPVDRVSKLGPFSIRKTKANIKERQLDHSVRKGGGGAESLVRPRTMNFQMSYPYET
jgi:hypothetical protein